MASDKITEIVDQSAFDQVEKLKKDMTTLAATFVDLFKQANAFNDALKSAKGIPEFKAQAAGASKATNELDRVLNELSKTREKLSISENRWTQALAESRLALQQINQETKDSVKLNLAAEGSVDQMRLQLKSLQNQWYALGKSAREAMGPGILANIQKTDAELKKLEFSTGRFQRNVGNYASGFNALNSSIAQLTREAPAFANSINTGFMAISNNLPMLSDAIKGIRSENKALAAEGKPTVSVLKQLAAGFFSWQTLLSVGVTLLTVYGGKIVEMITGKKKLALTQDDLNKAFEEGSKSVSNEITKMQMLYAVATDTNASFKARKNSVDELQKLYPSYLGNLSDEVIMTGKATDAYNELNKALISKAIYQGFVSQANKIGEQLTPLLIQLDRVNEKIESAGGKRGQANKDGYFVSGAQSAADVAYMTELEEKATGLLDKIEPLKRQMANLFKTASEYSNDLVTPGAKGAKDKPTSKPKDVNRIESLKKEYDNRRAVIETAYNNGEVDFLNYQMKLLEIATEFAKRRILVDESLTEAEKQSKVDLLNSMSKDTKGIFSGLTDAGKAAAKQLKEDATKNVAEASANIVKNAKEIEVGFTNANTAIVNLGSTKTFAGFVKELEELVNVIAPLFQSLSNIGGEIAGMIADKANFEADQAIKAIDKIEKAELDSLERMTMGAKQREEEKKKIEIQAEQRRAKAERDRITALRKAASVQKAADIAGIISGTALAIVNALKTQPAPLGIALAAGVGVTGAIQLARAIQTPLPQYAKGTDNHPGGAFIAGEAGIEQITMPDGKTFFTPDAATVFTAPKGTKVKSNEELLQDVYNTALIKLSAQGAVTHSKMDEALLEAFKENNSKLDNLTTAVEGLELSATFQNFSDHISHVKSRVR